jgi:MFS family permease
VILSDLVPLKQRGTYQGYINIVFSTGTSLGGPIGGIMSDLFGWRWSFGIQIPLMALSAFLIVFFLNLPNRDSSIESMRDKLKRVDVAGAITLVHYP